MRLNVPLLDEDELAEIAAVLSTGMLTQGDRARDLEDLVRGVTGTAHAAAVSSATTGLHLSLVALGIGPGDEVVMPAYSFPATANAVVQQGAVPIFVDIDPETFNIAPDAIANAMTERTRAIMPVHAFGLVADMDPILAIAGAHDLPVIEDAACALGGTYHGRAAGSLGTTGVFSFHPRKVITTAEGGMITTNDPVLAERIDVLRAHGAVRGELFMEFVAAGFNYRLSDVHAAIGVAQMRKFERIVTSRHSLADRLAERVAQIPGVTAPFEPDGLRHTYQSFVVMLEDGIDRDAVIRAMRAADVETTLGTYGMHLQPYFVERFGDLTAQLPHATRAHRQALTLPLYPQLRDEDLDLIAETLSSAVTANAR
ncbi:DegT/DnrJ/EryC1/StrS family aminotransferase [Microbacterium sp. M28]|uniref:DegT/DnrJ/EryC1/StrS family aminotransferase n=1 Tax=Microbacterium sp. M28 TaxID=2962064 RepID=UPI0021F4205A|nr:DegT/DnrJ/EryC1/StrS family aminotransferase [Microbacterium sp. M28]UYO98161.1 DegT/DnrJ/EryC1/StrS family aminotransferase [Microbacterium sp. M28]